MRYRRPGRWIIACINWSHSDAPHALLARIGSDGCFDATFYYPTHADAIKAVDAHRPQKAHTWPEVSVPAPSTPIAQEAS